MQMWFTIPISCKGVISFTSLGKLALTKLSVPVTFAGTGPEQPDGFIQLLFLLAVYLMHLEL